MNRKFFNNFIVFLKRKREKIKKNIIYYKLLVNFIFICAIIYGIFTRGYVGMPWNLLLQKTEK